MTEESSNNIHDYVNGIQRKETEVQKLLREGMLTHPYRDMQITRDQGALLSWLVASFQAKLVIEVGVFTGYSALCMAEVMPDDGKLIACDINEDWVTEAKPYWQAAKVSHKIEVRIGDARKTLPALCDLSLCGHVDFIFIDADKTGYPEYYEWALELLKPGGILVIDNIFLMGRILTDGEDKKTAKAMRILNTKIQNDIRVSSVVLPLYDGMTLVKKR